MKATAGINSDCAVSLRDNIKRGKFRILTNEIEGTEILNQLKTYQNLPVEKQVLFSAPYYQTSALINEMVNLSFELQNGKIRVKESHGFRKDRFSAASYANFFANELERKLYAMQEKYSFQTFIN